MDPENNGNGGEGGSGEGSGDDLGAAMRAAAAGEGAEGGGEGTGEGAAAGEGGGEGGEGKGGEGAAGAGDHKPLTPQEQRAMAQELSEIRAWRAEQEQNAATAKDKPVTKEAPKPMTDQEFSQLEARAGFIRSKVKNETTGEMEDRMSIDPRKQLEFVSGMMEHGLNALRQEFETMLHDNVSSLRRQDLFGDLEKDPSKEFSDIKQYSKAITDILADYPAKNRNDRKLVIKAFYEARGRGLRDVVKKIENKQNLNSRVIHPGGGNGKPGSGAGGGGAARPTGPAAAFLDKFDPAPAGKK